MVSEAQHECVHLFIKKYDTSGINPSTLTGPPSLSTLPVVTDTILDGYGITENGSRNKETRYRVSIFLSTNSPNSNPNNSKRRVVPNYLRE